KDDTGIVGYASVSRAAVRARGNVMGKSTRTGVIMESGKFLTGLLAAFAVALAGCGGGDGSNPRGVAGACTVDEKNQEVYALMKDAYYWYQHVPNVDPTDYSSPQALLDAIRYRPLDTTFSYL